MFRSFPVLKLPDFTKPFVVEHNAPDQAVGAVLLQLYNSTLPPMECFSKKYIPFEKNYVPHDNGLLEIFKAFQKWKALRIAKSNLQRDKIDGHPNMILTDYEPLVSLQT